MSWEDDSQLRCSSEVDNPETDDLGKEGGKGQKTGEFLNYALYQWKLIK